ncbi:uncharacterized protein MELLADRAFT_43958 [Melampsora larici-populina 98AG31]|uniref:J domain-containing protein n=1 Tax=Melampsora larici-populina (strain 98AG31 / pathotype 3-4-7) TaxID=747676 RepID=F4RR06_MELLP|nr:uncharacterized protein MELLADRAFT_43958 [Melampsora larici-populina 98AG31]EGG05230.1 hypothetical protein MELLADRAFT_43958 [Melampsora larici-populina 98AG31]
MLRKDYYEILDLPHNANRSQIRASYHKLAKQTHPDKKPSSSTTTTTSTSFHILQEAYETLIDEEKRKRYDDSLNRKPFDQHHHHEQYDEFNEFETHFEPKRKSQDSVIQFDCTLEDLYNGKKVSIEIERQLSCEKCHGFGYNRDARPNMCQRCSGQGFTIRVIPLNGIFASSPIVCTSCEGLGAKIRSEDQCSSCNRTGFKPDKVKVEFRIAKGMLPDHPIRLSDQGDAQPGCLPGDLVLKLNVLPHPTFQMPDPTSSDLLLPISITLSEALLGFDRLVFYHLDGQPIRLKIPSPNQTGHMIIKPNEIKQINGFGLPPNGNLFIKFLIDWPTKDWIEKQDLEFLEVALPEKKIDLGSSLSLDFEQVSLSFKT